MYAIFEAKGKQWRAEPGVTLRLPSMDAEPGDRVRIDRVLLAERGDEILVGRPALANAAVELEVLGHGKGEKIVVFKRKRRKGYRRKQGHRQPFTEVRVVEIDLDAATAPGPEESAAVEPAASEPEPAPGPGPEPQPESEAEGGPEAESAPEAESEPEEVEPETEIEATGAAERLAGEHGIDLTTVEGTGQDGRILKGDVQAAIDEAETDEA